MNPSSFVACLSLAPNLRCVPLNRTQFDVLIIPPAIELVFCASLIFLKWGFGRAHLLLAADSAFYFILALVDLLSHVIPAARSSITTFKAMDIFIGSVSFAPMLLYTSYLFWLSHREFISSLPPRHQSIFKYLLIILIPVAVAANEVASFVGVSILRLPDSQASLMSIFTNNSESLWLNLSQLSLALYTTVQILFFFLSFYRLVEAFLDQQRIETTLADEHHHFNGIGWITVGIKLGVIESIVGFALGGLAVPLSRRILRLFARGSLIIGILKGMDARENFEYLTHELASWRHSRPLSSFQLLMANRHMSRRPSQFPNIPQERSPIERVVKGRRADQRVTVHYEGGQAPFLQIRFSTLNFPEQAVVAGGSGVQSRRQSSSEIRDGIAQMHSGRSASAEIPAPRNASRSFLRESGHTISDSMSIVRELALRFPLPPRVTGRYRGSILGQRYEGDDDDYPLVGVSREPSTRRDNAQPREESAAAGSAVLSTSGSIKRKPAPPLLPIPPPAHTNEDRPSSSWGGLASKNSFEYTVPSPATPTRTRRSVDFPSTITDDESRGTPRRRPRQLTPRQLYDRASGALSVISIRSAEWLSSARSQPSSHPQLTPASIEAYYTGGTMISPQRASADPGDVMTSGSGEELLEADQYISIDGAAPSGTHQSRIIAHMSIGQVSTRTTPTPTVAQFPLGREPIASTYGEVQGID